METLNNVWVCPANHDGRFKITFDIIVCPGGYTTKDHKPVYNLSTPSVPNPGSYRNLQLIQKNLGWNSLDVIKCWNKEDETDAVIYLGKWNEEPKQILNEKLV
jgi:hypothetical protein